MGRGPRLMRSVVACALLLAACGRAVTPETRRAFADLVVPPEQCRTPGPEMVAPDALARDVDVLERVLRRGYAGFEMAADEARWARVFAETRAALPAAPIAPRAFRDLLVEQVGFVDDNHVGLWIFDPRRRWRSTSGHQQAYVASVARFTLRDGAYVDADGRTLVSCEDAPASDVVRPTVGETLPAIEYAPIVLSREPVESLRCIYEDEGEVTIAMERMPRIDHAGPAFERIEAPFPWLRLRTLFTDRRTALDEFVATAVTLRNESVIVLDMRQAGGGSDRFLIRWFRRLTSQPIAYWETDALASEATLQGALTFWGCVRAFGGADEGGREWLDARLERARRELDVAMRERGVFRDRTREARVLDGLAPGPYRGRLVLVVDRGCSSACETSVLLARQLPGTLIVGENTDGTMKVGELRWYRLPESRVWISLGMRVHHDPEGRFEESRGFLPDLWLDGRTPDDHIRALAACLADESCAAQLPRHERTERVTPGRSAPGSKGSSSSSDATGRTDASPPPRRSSMGAPR